MRELRGKVAVVTGAASGIGLAIAKGCAAEGAHIVLADIEESALYQAEEEIKASGARVLAVRTDVSKAEDIDSLAKRTLEAFGGVHLLFNNAGVGFGGVIWEDTLEDAEWVMGVNLWSVIYGLRTFVPIMLAQDTECHIVNTASAAGLMSEYPGSLYHLTKHAVVALSENAHHNLSSRGTKVKISVLCPAFVKTGIRDSERNRSPVQRSSASPRKRNWQPVTEQEEWWRAIENGMLPEELADKVLAAIRQEKFWILPHPEAKSFVQARMESILSEQNPVAHVIPT